MNRMLGFVSSTVATRIENKVRLIGLGDHAVTLDLHVILGRYDDPATPDAARDRSAYR